MSSHKQLIDQATKAIDNVHDDTSVSLETTLDSLREIRDCVSDLIECVRSQLAKPSLISIVYQCLSFIVMCGFVGWCLASLLWWLLCSI